MLRLRALAGLLVVLPLAACGTIGGDSGDKKESSSPPSAIATVERLTGRSTAIKLAPGFVAALGKMHVTAAPLGAAKLTKDGSAVFPITGGSVSVFAKGEVSPYVVGIVFHDGSGLSLTRGKDHVELTDLIVDPAFSRVYGDVTVNGRELATKLVLFELDGSTLQPLTTGPAGTAVLRGTKVEVSDPAAKALDRVFAAKAMEPGLLVGVATITVKVPKA